MSTEIWIYCWAYVFHVCICTPYLCARECKHVRYAYRVRNGMVWRCAAISKHFKSIFKRDRAHWIHWQSDKCKQIYKRFLEREEKNEWWSERGPNGMEKDLLISSDCDLFRRAVWRALVHYTTFFLLSSEFFPPSPSIE